MESKIIKSDFTKLNQFVRGLSQKHSLKVGILGNKTNRKESGDTNASIGAKHEFGSYSEGIPKRSFLRMPLYTKSYEILNKLKNKEVLKMISEGKMVSVFKRLGLSCENIIQKAFDTGGFGSWQQLKYRTLMGKLKGNLYQRRQKAAEQIFEGNKYSSILINTAQLRISVTSKVD